MLPKMLISALAILLIIAVLSFVWLSKQRDIPFQEVIPLDKGAAVINAAQWYNDKLSICLTSGNGKIIDGKYDQTGFCIFKDLVNGTDYTVEIKRTDLKGKILYKKMLAVITPQNSGVKYVVLVGASVGRSWSFDKLTERSKLLNNIVLGNRTKYDFDKSSSIEALVKTPVPVTGVIIKECAAYFPHDIEPAKKMIKAWVDQLRGSGIAPILATVVPVTKAHDKNHPDRYNSILEFNGFIRLYAGNQKILLLDLEKAVRINEKDRHLREEYAQPDGLHLVQKAYDEVLDRLVSPLMEKL